MKKNLLFLICLLFTINFYAQAIFEKGYYIDNSNQKFECFIKNEGWKYNPSEFEYKFSKESEKEQSVDLKNAKEFSIYGKYKFIRKAVKIDQSSTELNELSYERNPILQEQEIFLKVLIEGKASLYSYRDKYFYSINNAKIEQLIFKEYYNKDKQVLKNNDYKRQVLKDLQCAPITTEKLEKLDYLKSELVDLFIAYNKCKNENFENFTKKQKRDLFNLNFRPGLNYSSISLERLNLNRTDINFDPKIGFRFGVELEFITSVFKNKWALIFEPTYQHFKTETTAQTYFGSSFEGENVKIDYTTIELPIGIRHYLFLNKKSKFFINASFVININNNSIIDFEKRQDLDIETSNNLVFGIGYKNNDKYSLEFRYHFPRGILREYTTSYNTVSVIFGYTLF
ncbi:tRNA modification GTPase [Polaribacter sp.]|uniref:tRNA modification GTPase n=1 Tax=Polaribacter sp. TaxID=1920175 RepID=UPI003F6BF846